MFNILSSDQTSLVPINGALLSSRHTRIDIPDGTAGTAATIAQMQKMCSAGKRSTDVRETVGKILFGKFEGIPECTPKDYRCYAESIYKFCRDHIKYAFDPTMVEWVEHPSVLLKNRIGDCDSNVTLLCAMWENVGLDAQYVTIKADRDRPNEYSHVYARVKIPGVGWVTADPTMPKKNFGWEAEGNYTKRFWPASTDDLQLPLDTSDSAPMSGMGCGGNCGCKGCASKASDSAIHGLGACMTFCGSDRKPSMPGRSGFRRAIKKIPLHATAVRPTRFGVRGLGIWPFDSNSSDGSTKANIASILNGSTLREITRLKNEYQGHAADLDGLRVTLSRMPSGPEKDAAAARQAQAEEALRQEFVAYNNLRSQYNAFVTQVKPYTFGAYNPSLAGMGILGVDDAVIAGIVVIGALAILANNVATAAAAVNGKSVETRGYIDQLANALNATGNLAEKGADAVSKVAVVAAVGLIGYAIFKNKKFFMKYLNPGI